jgi:LAS superfamily LD-carboxypeptidase LdcB
MSDHQPTSRRAELVLSELELYSEYRNCERWALIVGISQYKYSNWNLRYAHRDAEELYNLLLTPTGGNFKKEFIRKLTNEEATTGNITRALRAFLKKPAREDLVIIYFACHGTPDFDRPGNVYLLTHDTAPDDIAGTALPMREIDLSLRENLLAEKVIVLADTCHSAAIAGGIGRRSAVDDSTFVNRYLQEVSRARGGIALLTSAEANEVSFEDARWGGGHGVFTYYLLLGMRGAGDHDGNGIVTVGELFEYVRDNVKLETNHQQHPSIGTNAYDRNLPVAIVSNANFSTTFLDKVPKVEESVFKSPHKYNKNSISWLLHHRTVGVSSGIFILISLILVFLKLTELHTQKTPDPSPSEISQQWPSEYIPSSTSLTVHNLTLQIQETGCNFSELNDKVRKLDKQILSMMQSIDPDSLVSFKKLNVEFTDNYKKSFPFLQLPATKSLEKAINKRGVKLRITRGYDSIVEQQIFRNFTLYNKNKCGVNVSAPPGHSVHNSGLAIDIADYEGWRPFLKSEGWEWLGTIDPPHFDFVGSGTYNIRTLPTLAFQKLWNLNHPEDKIPEDGEYTPETEQRLNESPIDGFPKGGRAIN